MDQYDPATMLDTKRLTGVVLEVNLIILLHAGNEECNPPLCWILLWNPEQVSWEIQNRGISGHTKKTHILQNILKHLKR